MEKKGVDHFTLTPNLQGTVLLSKVIKQWSGNLPLLLDTYIWTIDWNSTQYWYLSKPLVFDKGQYNL